MPAVHICVYCYACTEWCKHSRYGVSLVSRNPTSGKHILHYVSRWSTAHEYQHFPRWSLDGARTSGGSEPCINKVWPMTFRFLFDRRQFRSISLAKYMAVFCVDFAANCTTGTTNMSIQYKFMKTMSLYLAVFVYLTLFVHRASSRTKPAN